MLKSYKKLLPSLLTWSAVVTTAQWSTPTALVDHTSVVFQNKLWVLAGSGKHNFWYSATTGSTWSTANIKVAATTTNRSVLLELKLELLSRSNHTSVVYDSTNDGVNNPKLWVLGGSHNYYGKLAKNDVWYSTNGVSWTKAVSWTTATDNANWSVRENHTSVVFDNKLWVLGGYDGKVYLNDVWSSSNGKTWVEETKNSTKKWPSRYGHTSVVFNDKLWVLGGYDGKVYLNDVWSSSDGKTWVEETKNSTKKWPSRFGHTSVVFDKKIWVFAGADRDSGTPPKIKRDVWYSKDGVNWTKHSADIPSKRFNHASVVFSGKIWLLGGGITGLPVGGDRVNVYSFSVKK